MKKGIFVALWIIYFLCLVPALVTLGHRLTMDKGFNSVALVTDYVKVLEISQAENIPVDDVLVRIHNESGIEKIALVEDTPLFLAQRGLCTIIEGIGWPDWQSPREREEIERNEGREPNEPEPPGADWPLLLGLSHDMNHLIITDPDVFQRVSASAQMRYGNLVEITGSPDGGGVVSLAGDPRVTLEWGLGFDTDLMDSLRGMGFEVYPRLRDYPGYQEDTIQAILENTAEFFPESLIIFDGDNVLGGTGSVRLTAETMSQLGLRYGWIEFAEQVGAASLAWLSPATTARVHSVEEEIQEVYSIDALVARYVRAARERSVRVIYLKPFLMATDNSDRVEKSLQLFSGVKGELESAGFTIGEPSLMGQVRAGIITLIAAVLLLAAGSILALKYLGLKLNPVWMIIIAILSFALWLVMGIKYVGLGIAIICPTLAVIWLVARFDGVWLEIRKLRITPLWPAIGCWFGAIAITLTGAFMIAASLVDEKILLGIDSFSGVKLALYLPVLIAAIVGAQVMLHAEKKNLYDGVKWLLNVNLKIWIVILGLVGLISVFVLLDRSGNFPIVPVADWENQFRGWFENLLYARPRTKEMLIGHPALFLGLYLGFSRILIRRELMYAGTVVGAIALTSMTNTFCHLHTPLILSLYRTFGGLIIGLIIGLIVGAIIMGLVRHGRQHTT